MSNSSVAAAEFLRCADEMKAAAEALRLAAFQSPAGAHHQAALNRCDKARSAFAACWLANEGDLRRLLSAGIAAEKENDAK